MVLNHLEGVSICHRSQYHNFSSFNDIIWIYFHVIKYTSRYIKSPLGILATLSTKYKIAFPVVALLGEESDQVTLLRDLHSIFPPVSDTGSL